MIGAVRRIAHRVRNSPGLRHATWLWKLGKAPYYRFLGTAKNGVPVTVAGSCTLPMPPEFCGGNWEAYETAAVLQMVEWLRRWPDPLVLDIGCEAGFYSLLALSANQGASVIGFDPDRANLKKTQLMCRHAAARRLTLVNGFLSDSHQSGQGMQEAAAATDSMLRGDAWRQDEGRNTYMALDADEGKPIPTHSLDGLFEKTARPDRQVLLKCDVEGAELLVLKGATRMLRQWRPSMLISVHPDLLPRFGHSANQFREYVEAHGYTMRLLGVDHEEHWWCEPRLDFSA